MLTKPDCDIELTSFEDPKNNEISKEPEANFSEESIFSQQEKWSVFLLHCLYFVQGIPFGLFGLAIPYFLVEAGADFSQIGILSFCLYPFCLKILLAPMEDIYFLKSFGKRKTYIIPCQYLLILVLIFLSFIVNGLLKELDVVSLCIIGFLLVTINAFQDVAVDGWVLTLLSNENVKWGAVAQTVGQAIGIIFGGSISVQLAFVIKLSNLIRIFAGIILLITLWVHLFIKEKNPKKNEYEGVWHLVKDLRGFYTNKNLRYCVIFCLTNNLGFAAILNTAPLKLIQKGLSKEALTTISMCIVPINLSLGFLMGHYGRIGKELTIFLKFYVILFFHNVFLFILINAYDGTEGSTFLIFYSIVALIGEGTTTCVMVNQGGFVNRISDVDVGGTFLTFLNSTWNLGRFGANSLVLFLADTINFTVLAIVSWIFAFVYIALFFKTLIRLEKLNKENWKF